MRKLAPFAGGASQPNPRPLAGEPSQPNKFGEEVGTIRWWTWSTKPTTISRRALPTKKVGRESWHHSLGDLVNQTHDHSQESPPNPKSWARKLAPFAGGASQPNPRPLAGEPSPKSWVRKLAPFAGGPGQPNPRPLAGEPSQPKKLGEKVGTIRWGS